VKLVKLPPFYHLLLSERLNRSIRADTWSAATGPKITYDAARVGAGQRPGSSGQRDLPGPLGPATRAEQNYLRAMAEDEDTGSSSGEIAARLGRGAGQFRADPGEPDRKGLVDAPEHGMISFTGNSGLHQTPAQMRFLLGR
jgi:hypothetical protein